MTTPLLVYLCLTAALLLLGLWVSASALLTEPEVSGLHRGVAVAGSLGAICIAGMAMFATHFGMSSMHWVQSLMPAVFLAGSWSVLLSMRTAGIGFRIACLPILTYNLLLTGVYTALTLQEAGGLDLGTIGATLASADAFVQTRIGHPGALENPLWMHLPVVLPLSTGLAHIGSSILGSSLATILLAAFLVVMPHASSHSRSYYSADPAALDPDRSGPVGFKVPWGSAKLSEVEKLWIRNHLGSLGARWATFEVDLAALRDPGLQMQMREEIEWARGMGIQACAITRPAARFRAFPAASLLELHEDMLQTHRAVATQLKPDLLVLYAGPLGRLSDQLGTYAGVAEWLEAIQASATEVRQHNQELKLCVSIERMDSQGQSLFEQLRSGSSLIDVVGLSIYPGERSLDVLEADLALAGRWLAGGSRPVIVLEVGAVPQVHGGEIGQWNLISRVLQFAAEENELEATCIDALLDKHRDRGILTFSGRRRLSYRQLLERSPADARPGK